MSRKFSLVVALVAVLSLCGCSGENRNDKTRSVTTEKAVADSIHETELSTIATDSHNYDSDTVPMDNKKSNTVENKEYTDENGIQHIFWCHVNEFHRVGKYSVSVVSEEDMNEIITQVQNYPTHTDTVRYAGKINIVTIDYDVDSIMHRRDSIRFTRSVIANHFGFYPKIIPKLGFGFNYKELRGDTLIFDGGIFEFETDNGCPFEIKYIDGKIELVELEYSLGDDD